MSQATPDAIRPRFTRDEKARKSFTSSLRAHVLGTQARRMREHYDEVVQPAFQRAHGRPPADGQEVRSVMKRERDFHFFSSVRSCAQEMVFASVIPAVERDMETLADRATELAGDSNGVGGSLTLDSNFQVPENVTRLDVHLAPGSFHAEWGDDDVSAGAIYDSATRVFAFRQFGEDMNDIGMTMSNFVRLRYPDFKPTKILDCGCTVGHNTLPWKTTFPDAEMHAIDVGPGLLRYAHARAQALEIPVHFHQMSATNMAFEDNSFDVVFSSMFLHELPLKDIKAFFAEAHRVLRPGGLLINMELPPNARTEAYQSFHLDWDTYYNNEPHYKPFRDQDYQSLCVGAGFQANDCIEVTLPRYTFIGEEEFSESVHKPAVFDNSTGRMNPKGTRWYGFGAFKAGETA
ncbi:MAG: class I SAM-dependent methyltransferase [Pseudomonadota bacterium]